MDNDEGESSDLEFVGLRLTGALCPPERVRAALLSVPSLIDCQFVELLLSPSSDGPGAVVMVDRNGGVAVRRAATVLPPQAEGPTLSCQLEAPAGDVGWLVAHECPEPGKTGRQLRTAAGWLADAMVADPLDRALGTDVSGFGDDRFTDPLTGLRDRRFLYAVGPQQLSDSQGRGDLAALFLLDLDDFKTVNDTLGHDAGDEALRQVAVRLSAAVGMSGVVSRLAGDEFVVLVPRLGAGEDADRIAEKIAQQFETPFRWREVSLHIDASMGIALHPRDGSTLEDLMRIADESMYAAKSSGPGLSWQRTGAALPLPSQRLVTQDDLASAIRDQELLVHYQPQVDSSDGRVMSFETFVRWEHPRLGLLEPADFLRLTERSGLMAELTRTVLRHALQDFSTLSTLAPDATISVNMSARSLLGRGLVDDLVSRLREYDVPPSRLIIEVNEPPARHSRSTMEIFGALHAVGCQASIHDYGSGQVSLAVLSRYRAIREVKIDPALVARVLDPESATMIGAIITMAHVLGLRTVAEGIESEELAATLRSLACDRLQGFHIAPPMPMSELMTWLSDR